jgi:hypothetical protein
MNKYKYDTTTLTASAYDKRISIELPLDANAEELMDAFATLLKGLTFPDGVWEDMIMTQAEIIRERENNELHKTRNTNSSWDGQVDSRQTP